MSEPDRNRQTSIGFTAVEVLARESTAFPETWHTDWDDEPYRFKLIQDVDAVALDPFMPLCYDGPARRPRPRWEGGAPAAATRIAHLLLATAGLLQTRRDLDPRLDLGAPREPVRNVALDDGEILHLRPSASNYFRAVSSGGALYPWEIYLALTARSGFAPGLYHYDVAHHRLDVLRDGDATPLLEAAAGGAFDAAAASAVVIITAVFWKNAFKYSHGSARLHGLDSGILAAQFDYLAPGFGFSTRALTQFVDGAVSKLLGVDPGEEAPQLLLALEEENAPRAARIEPPPLEQLVAALPEISVRTLQRSRNVKPVGLARELSRFSVLTAPAGFAPPEALAPLSRPSAIARIPLPPPTDAAAVDLGVALRMRRSGIDHIVKRALTLGELSILCSFAAGPYAHLYCFVNRADDVEPGVYLYDASGHALDCIRRADAEEQFDALQRCYRLGNINVAGASAAFFAAGDYGAAFAAYGNRGHRILNLEAGGICGRLYLATGWLGLGGHAILGFDAAGVASLLGLSGDVRPLIGFFAGAPKQSRVSLRMPLWI